jgi:hypothetical protein
MISFGRQAVRKGGVANELPVVAIAATASHTAELHSPTATSAAAAVDDGHHHTAQAQHLAQAARGGTAARDRARVERAQKAEIVLISLPDSHSRCSWWMQ